MYRFASAFFTTLFTAFVLYLLLLSGFSTTAIDAIEHSYLINDHMFFQLILVGGLILFCAKVFQKSKRLQEFVHLINEDETYSCRWRKRLLFFLFTICTAVLLILQKVPRGDQRFICDMANSMMNGDYYGFNRGQYLDLYPNQLGIVLFLYGLAHIFGSYNYLAFQFINACALICIYHDFAEISDETGHSRFAGLAIIGLGILFLPAILYTTFVYGTLLGFALSIRVLRHLRKVLWILPKHQIYQRRRKKVMSALLEFLLIGVNAFAAVAVKTNYKIFLIALLFYVILSFFQGGKKENLLLRTIRAFCVIGVLTVVLLFSQRIINKGAAVITKCDISSGLSPWSWMAMGMQENTERYDGWYNGYGPNTYSAANSSTERQKLIAQEDFAKRMRFFLNNPLNALRFFAGKNASQWNNPDFQSFWITNHARHTVQYSRLINALFSPDGITVADQGLNFLQFIILFGSFLCVLPKCGKRKREQREPEIYFYELCLIGGILFYSFWEAKAQYTLVHFMCLMPLAVYGYERTLPELVMHFHTEKEENGKFAFRERLLSCCFIQIWMAIFLLSVIILAGKKQSLISSLFLRGEDTKNYQVYLQNHRFVRLKTGYVEDLENASLVYSHYDNHCYLKTADSRALTVDDEAIEEGKNLIQVDWRGCVFSAEQSWNLRRSDEVGEYYFIHTLDEKEFALTREENGGLCLRPFDGEAWQKWSVTTEE